MRTKAFVITLGVTIPVILVLRANQAPQINWATLAPILTAVTITAVLFRGLSKEKVFVWETLVHEQSHAIAALFLGRTIRSFWVSPDNPRNDAVGQVEYFGGSSGFITLAPYILPYPAIPVILVAQIVNPERAIIPAILAWTMFSIHARFAVKQVWGYQSDLEKVSLGEVVIYSLATYTIVGFGLVDLLKDMGG